MQGEQLKQVRVKLGTCIPLGRKFLVIREGEQILKLKAVGGDRSVYSIEDQAVVSTGSTRSGKQHFRYSFPKFVNGVGGMNSQQSKGDHVAVTEKNLSSGVSQRRKNFAKKSTSNNFRRTLQQAQSFPEKPTHQLLHKDALASRRSRSRSPADIHQRLSSLKPAEELKVQTKDRHVSGEQKDLSKKDRRSEKPLDVVGCPGKQSGRRDSTKDTVITTRDQHKQNGQAEEQGRGKESSAKDVGRTVDHVNNKENHPKLTEQSSGEEREKQASKDGNTPVSDTMQKRDGSQQERTSVHSEGTDPIRILEKSAVPAQISGTEHRLSSSRDTENAKVEHSDRRQRASTPNPESPVKNSALSRLSRKRHRSASPKVVLPSDESTASVSLSVKVVKDSIKLDSTKFGMVKKLCKNAISQRKDLVQKGSSETHKVETDKCKPNSKQTKRKNTPSPDHLSSASKKQKLSGTKGGQPNGSSTPRSSDSEDALTKLMKDFQSATSSPHRRGSKHTSEESSINSSRSSPEANTESPTTKTQKTTASSADLSIQCDRSPNELDALQTEDVSSDEEFDPSQEMTEEEDTNTAALKDISSQKKDTAAFEGPDEKPAAPVDNFLLVDEVGYTPPNRCSPPIKSAPSHGTPKINSTPKDDDHVLPEGRNQAMSEVVATRELKEETKPEVKEDKGDKQAEEPRGSKQEEGINGTNGFVVSAKKLLAVKQELCNPLEQHRQDLEQKIPHEEVEELLDIEKSKPPVMMSSTAMQTDHDVDTKEQSCQTQEPKPDVKHQYVQFDSEPQEIDPEEVTRIVSAMIESESEEKERLKKSLQESTQKEERWRDMVKDLCRQLRELRQQLEKKEDKVKKDSSTNTDTEMSALPCIISTQASQTEYGKNIGTIRMVSTNGVQGSKSENPSNTVLPGPKTSGTSKVDNVIVVEGETDPPRGSEKSQAINLEEAVRPTVPDKPATTASSPAGKAILLKAPNQMVQKVSEEVIDLTESEDPTSAVNKHTQQTVVLTRSPTGSVQTATFLTSKANTVKLVPAANVSLLRPTQTQHHVPSSVQGVPKPMQNRVSQNAVAPVTSVNRISTQGIGQVVVSQATASAAPPPLQAAPNVTVYNTAPNQLPVLKQLGNFNMIFQNQAAQPRQEVLLAQQVIQPRQMIQAQGFATQQQQQQQQVPNAVLRGVMAQYPGSTNIIIPRSTMQQQQQQGVPVRMPQTQAKQQLPMQVKQQQLAMQNQKVTLERKKEQITKQLQGAIQQQNTEQWNELTNQIQTIMAQIAQLDRLQQSQLSPNAPSHGTRFVQQPTTYTATNPPIGQVTNSQQAPQIRNATQHKQVPAVLASQPNNSSMRIVNKTWFPAVTNKVPQNKVKQPVQPNTNARSPPHNHPAPLPILQSYNNVGKGVLLPPPSIRISKSSEGVVLSWNISTSQEHPTVKKYFLYAYQVLNAPPNTSHWKRIGEVGALPPPMACTLNQFQPGSTYFLAICAVDVYERPGKFSKTEEVVIT